ncbi:uncharacterized protein LOC127280014 [Leptopilina boulardi]|uniref:uncharacterized protein LOC127280014 n=1 Tax=Leptopilina boulardi TaxID=63433 RepID=UPI0021F586AB|nr:uncharacterized protein LOC127280014 [Leptopilina boulardi]
MSFILRNLTCLRRCTTAIKYQNCATYSLNEESNKKLENDRTSIFDYIEKNHEHLTSENCLEILKKISISSYNVEFKTPREKKNILIVCDKLDKQIDNINLYEAIDAVKLLKDLKIKKNSIIFTTLLKKIQNETKSIKDTNFTELEEIRTLLIEIKIDEAKLLRKDIQESLDSTIRNNNNNIFILCTDLYNAVHFKDPDKKLIVSILRKISKYPLRYSVGTAASIYTSSFVFPDIIIKENFNIRKFEYHIIGNITKLSFKNILDVIKRLSVSSLTTKFSNDLYNSEFIDFLITSLMSNENFSFEIGIDILYDLQNLRHHNTKIIDYLMIKCFENPRLILKLNRMQLIAFTLGLSISIETPPLWDSIKQYILKNERSKLSFTKQCYNLILLNYYNHELISLTFKNSEAFFNQLKIYEKIRIRFIYQMVKTLEPSYKEYLPSVQLLKYFSSLNNINRHVKINDNVLNTLEKALGGHEYVQSNVFTKYDHFLHHIVVMRKGGFPVAINHVDNRNVSVNIEDIIIPPESKIIAFLYYGNNEYYRNVKHLRKKYIIYNNSIESLGYSVIPINLDDWTNMNQKEKIPFIMNEIKLRYTPNEI